MMRLLLALLPGFLHRRVLIARGHLVSPQARIRFGTVLNVDAIELAAGAQIGPFTRVRAKRLELGVDAIVRPLTSITANRVAIGRQSTIASFNIISGDPDLDTCHLTMGSHSQTFQFCWLDPGRGITIGDRSGIGGHGLIFTHGSWSNYFRGAPVSFGPVVIEDRVWLPWRVFVMPNVTIGSDAIIGAGSVVTKDVPRGALAGGIPAKVLRSESHAALGPADLDQRFDEVLSALRKESWLEDLDVQRFDCHVLSSAAPAQVYLVAELDASERQRLLATGATVIDLVREEAWLGMNEPLGRRVTAWLTRFGVRADILDAPGNALPGQEN